MNHGAKVQPSKKTTSAFMPQTPEDIAKLPINSPEKRRWLLTASARDIQAFIHAIVDMPYTVKEYELARTALEVRISEDQSAAAEKLERQTHTLIRFTTRLYYLTWGLLALTAGLLVFTIWLVMRH
jgi:hypothetical protein